MRYLILTTFTNAYCLPKMISRHSFKGKMIIAIQNVMTKHYKICLHCAKRAETKKKTISEKAIEASDMKSIAKLI